MGQVSKGADLSVVRGLRDLDDTLGLGLVH
jgi:hypothetical protein